MTVRLYQSTDASAPTLTGQAGSLTTLLDAVLVNGYGSQPAAGWSIAQTTTNKRGYQQATGGNSGATGCSLWVDDSAPTTAKEARVTGFETMTGLGTGTGQFPTGAQLNIGTTPNGAVIIRKSTTADATARAWRAIANGHAIYLSVDTGDITNPTASFPFFFGDFFSYHASDTFAISLQGRASENNANGQNESFYMGRSSGPTPAAVGGQYVDRSWTGVGGSVPIDKIYFYAPQLGGGGGAISINNLPNVNATMGPGFNETASVYAYPNPADGSLSLSPFWIFHNNTIRGYMPGLWVPLHNLPLNHLDTFTVSGGNLNGKSFIGINVVAMVWNANNAGVMQFIIETSDTWS